MFGFSQVFLGRAYKGCYPTFTHDANGIKTKPAYVGPWPNTESGTCTTCDIKKPELAPLGCPAWTHKVCNGKSDCRLPSNKGIGNPGDSFPVYYTFKKCNETTIRVQYNLFWEKDGFTEPWGHW